MATTRRSKAKQPLDHSATINFALEAAAEVVIDEKLDELDWLIVLKQKVAASDTPFRDGDLLRYLRQAKLNRDGRKDYVGGTQALKMRDQEWLWHGVIMREATNIVFALPKVGKTRLMLAMLAEFLKGRGEFAGVPMTPGKEKVLILGPDQSESAWASYLIKVGLCSAEGFLINGVLPMVTAETMFTLDEYWLSSVEEKLRAHGPLIVLLDSYSAAIRALGLDENKTEAAMPLMKLHNLVHQYNSTLIVIHHSNKAGGDGNAVRASRGSSAITAAADNLIEMKAFKNDQDDGVKKYELHVEGRAEAEAAPLLGYSKHSAEWVSCGSIRELREEQAKDDQYEALTGHQLMVLDALVTSSVNERKALSVGDLSELIHEKPSKSQKVMMSKTVKRLESLGFCIDAGSRSSASGPATITYLSTPWAVSKHQITL
jgi:RecA-family ATPase